MIKQTFDYFLEVNRIFWGTDIYQWWFYLNILIILVLCRDKIIKRIMAVFPLFFVISLINPVTYKAMQMIAPDRAYYARLYSMLPIPYTIMFGTVYVLDRVAIKAGELIIPGSNETDKSNRTVKNKIAGLFISFICCIIVIGGTDIYKQDWMKPAQNRQKVPNEVIWLCEALHQDEGVTIAVPGSLSTYIRQIDGAFFMPYGRDLDALGNELSKEHPDPNYVMNKAGSEACDYIVVINNPENIDAFNSAGWSAFLQIGSYLVYKIENVPRVRKKYNAIHQLILITYLDSNGNPSENEEGFASICYEYDNEGNQKKEAYLDAQGNRVKLKQGYSAILRSYTLFSRRVSRLTYLDQNDELTSEPGYATVEKEYDSRKNLIKETYYDEDNHIMLRTNGGYAAKEYYYDKDNQLIGEVYYGIDRQKCLNMSGYAEYKRSYNDNGRIITEEYYDIYGNRCETKGKYSRYERENNEGGYLLRESYYGIYDELVMAYGVYAEKKRDYNEQGRAVREYTLDTNGKLVCRPQGYALIAWEYNEYGQLVQESYYDENNHPTTNSDGYFKMEIEYDALGSVDNRIYYDLYGSLIK